MIDFEQVMKEIEARKAKWPRNVTTERIDVSGRFKVITTYGDGGPPQTRIERIDTKFRSGKSGNPRGRPKGSRNAATLLKELFNVAIPVRTGERKVFMSNAEAMIRMAVVKALRGDARLLAAILDILEMTGWLDEGVGGLMRHPMIVDETLTIEEYELLHSPERASDRQRYLRMAEAGQ
jgi:hypothetical protein